jgi:dGTPase
MRPVDGTVPHDAVTPSERSIEWARTMRAHERAEGDPTVLLAHADTATSLGRPAIADRRAREDWEDATLAPGATRAVGAGDRAEPEDPDPERTCFERDRDRIVHGTAFRRLAGKTQVFVLPEDHQRTRLTHAIEVAQVAVAIARSVGANVALTEAIALGHDCGHGPGGHASEDAFSPFLDGGYDHAVWGADVVLASLNLCTQTLDGIRNHSWSRPAPSTPEGEIVSWADRIAYVCHDFEDAAHVGITSPDLLPPAVRDLGGDRRSRQLHAFIDAVVATTRATGSIGMDAETADALAEFRRFNYDHIYMRPASLAQSASVIRVLRALVEFYADRPHTLPDLLGPDRRPVTTVDELEPGTSDAFRLAVAYVGGMTDRFAFARAQTLLGWSSADLPVGIG